MGVTANKYEVSFGVTKCSKFDSDDDCTTL